MGIPTFYSSQRTLSLLGATLALYSLVGVARADTTPQEQSVGTPSTASASKVQVAGNQTTMSLDASEVPVQNLLKMIFTQVHAQFTVGSGVAGQVTMHLTDQSLPTILDAISKQLLLQYKIDAHGIYVFEQDPDAAKAAIAHIQDLNAQMRQQLRTLGVSLPDDTVLNSALRNATQGPAGLGGQGGSSGNQAPGGNFGRGAGGFGGGPERSAAPPGQAGRRGGAADSTAQKAALPRNSLSKPDAYQKDNVAVTDLAKGLNILTADQIAEIFGLNSQNNGLQNPDAYRAWLQQNGYVFINTGGQKTPVTAVLQELSRQSNTQILIDPSVPTGPKFSLQGYITPRSLSEALNVLTQSTRLTWRWWGANVYVEALPDFQLFFNSTAPRVIYGNSALQTQQGFNGGQQQSNISNYAPPSQTPLPITNGEKKTP